MIRVVRPIVALAVLVLLLAGCTGGGDAEPDRTAGTPAATATPAATPPPTPTHHGFTDCDADLRPYSNSHPNRRSDANPDRHTDTHRCGDTRTHAETSRDAEASRHTHTDTHRCGDTRTHAETSRDAEASRHTHADADRCAYAHTGCDSDVSRNRVRGRGAARSPGGVPFRDGRRGGLLR